MNKLNILELFKKGLTEIPSCLFRFVRKAFCVAWIYAYISAIPITFAVVVMFLLKSFTVNAGVAVLVFKILATIGQIIPLSFALYTSEWELVNTDEDSAELCFVICALVIAYIWFKI